MAKKSSYVFKAEVKQLLDILVHSLYTNKEIFLRELVSNASDAMDKHRHTALSASSGEDGPDLEVRIGVDQEAGTITVSDAGIGMTREELRENLGTIAHSGSAEFAKAASEGKESLDTLIGRFGVGFYSVYMVADTVDVVTRSGDGPALLWTSDGQGSYEIMELGEDRPRGTSVVVHLKEDLAKQFADAETLKRIIKKHSNFISYPIFVDNDRVNTVPALWREPKFQIKPEQYNEFYSFLTYDEDEPLRVLHHSVDAPVQYQSLLFIPKGSNDMFGMRDEWGPDLYVRRVLIERKHKELLPQYLSFMAGVVDTEDLPLNISRETLQDSLLIRKINTTLTKQVLAELKKMAAEDADNYKLFWDAHSEIFKTGYQDFANRETFGELVRFNSSIHEDGLELTSLDEYISRAKPDQKEIYYLYGPSREALNLSPHVEIFRKKDVEVLYLYEPIDEFIMDALREYKEFSLVSAEHADATKLKDYEDTLKDESEALTEEEQSGLDGLLKDIKDILGDKVTQVKASDRLSQSPVCLANPDGQVTSSMDKIMRVITKDSSVPKKVLEVNPTHRLIKNLIAVHAKDPGDPFIAQAANQLFESAMLLEGYLNDPHALVGRIQELLTDSSGWYLGGK